jgi:hypothetical protein
MFPVETVRACVPSRRGAASRGGFRRRGMAVADVGLERGFSIVIGRQGWAPLHGDEGPQGATSSSKTGLRYTSERSDSVKLV